MSMSFDADNLFKAIDKLADDGYKVARSMGVAAGVVLRDEAKTNVGVHTGKLRSAIYVAFDEKTSTANRIRYNVSWNNAKAPHGHLVEFGHWRTNVVIQLPNGQWHTTKEKLAEPVKVKPVAFLRRAHDTMQPHLFRVAVTAGQRRLRDLLNGGT